MLHVERLQESGEAILEYVMRRGVEVPPDAAVKLSRFVESLLRWNERHNLISRGDTGRVWTRHVLHSIGVLISRRLPDEMIFADIGTGGGFPGVPIAILKPKSKAILIESIAKKAETVGAITREARLTNVTVVHGRAEDPRTVKRLRQSCDLVFSRAVAPLVKLAGWSVPLLKPCPSKSGLGTTPAMVALKGGDVLEEVRALLARYPHAEVDVADMDLGDAVELEGKKIVTITFPGTR